jgi:hypothetical protein
MTPVASGESNVPNLEDLLRLGITTAKAGNKEGARVIFQQVIANDKRNERAWLWLASVEDSPIERRRILQTVLEMNPNNANAKKLLGAMDRAVASSEKQSMMLGIRILIGLVVLIAIVAFVVLLISR